MIVTPDVEYDVFFVESRESLNDFYTFLTNHELFLDIQDHIMPMGRVAWSQNITGLYDCYFQYGQYFFVSTKNNQHFFTRDSLDGYVEA